jgi:adenosylhomocysteine nucleosidase
VCAIGKNREDVQGINNEILREGRGLMTHAYYTQEHHLEDPIPHDIVIKKYAINAKSRKVVSNVKTVSMDIGILTVVPDEIFAIKKILAEFPHYKACRGKLSVRNFYEGALPAANGQVHRVACLRALEQGNLSIMSAYHALAEEYSPTLMILLGIGGSINKEAKICDVVFADSVYYYDKRSETQRGTHHKAISYNIASWLRNEINHLFDHYGDKPEFESYPDSFRKKFRLLLGPIGTGGAVIKHRDADERKWLNTINEKTLALDTESAGISQQFSEDQLKYGYKPKGYLIVRGISDHADEKKNDKWRIPAAANAMLAMMKMIENIPSGLSDLIPEKTNR